MDNDQMLDCICQVIALAAAGASGNQLKIQISDWKNILHLAHEHNVLPLLACGLLYSPDLHCPDDIRVYVLNAMRTSSSVNTLRRQRVFYLLNELKKAGFDVKLLKGYAAARYYMFPESRDSADIDILVDAEQETAIYAFFETNGFQTEERGLTSHHGICQHKKYGKIEVHTSLYEEIVDDVWFRGMGENCFIRDNFETVSTLDGVYITLGPTDQLIFLTLHMMKHFIEGGLSIRMMLDVVLHYTRRSKDIDTKRYWNLMEELHYIGAVTTIFEIMSQYIGCSVNASGTTEVGNSEQSKILLYDLAMGGYMGSKQQKARYESGMEYNRQLLLKKVSPLQYKTYMLRWKIRSGYKIMCPSTKYLYKKYKFLENCPLIFPLVWIYQMVSYAFQKLHAGVLKRDIRTDSTVMNAETKRRVDMFKLLGML